MTSLLLRHWWMNQSERSKTEHTNRGDTYIYISLYRDIALTVCTAAMLWAQPAALPVTINMPKKWGTHGTLCSVVIAAPRKLTWKLSWNCCCLLPNIERKSYKAQPIKSVCGSVAGSPHLFVFLDFFFGLYNFYLCLFFCSHWLPSPDREVESLYAGAKCFMCVKWKIFEPPLIGVAFAYVSIPASIYNFFTRLSSM